MKGLGRHDDDTASRITKMRITATAVSSSMLLATELFTGIAIGGFNDVGNCVWIALRPSSSSSPPPLLLPSFLGLFAF